VNRRSEIPGRHLIVQLARYGDLLQTAPLVSAAANGDSPQEVHLLVDASLAGAAALIDNVAKVHLFDRTAFSKELLSNDLSAAYGRVSVLAQALRSENFHQVSNITHTPESACITALAGADTIEGLTRTRVAEYSNGLWDRLFRATLTRRGTGAFHLVDLHLGLSGLSGVDQIKSWLKLAGTKPGSGPVVAFQLGANSPLRSWNSEMFATTAKLIETAMPSVGIVLVGSKGEQSLAAEFERHHAGVVTNLTGKTNLQELSEIIAGCSLLISGDTGTIHLAAALNVPSVGVYLGMARADDTAPYREGSIIFEPRHDCYPCPENNRCGHLDCHGDIPPQAVAAAALSLLKGNTFAASPSPTYRWRSVKFDKHGSLTLTADTVSQNDWRERMRRFWFDEMNGACHHNSDRLLNPTLRELSETTSAALAAARRFELALIGANQIAKARDMLKHNLAALEVQAQRSDETGLLAHIFQLELENLPSDPRLVAGRIKLALENLSRRVKTFPSRELAAGMPMRVAV